MPASICIVSKDQDFAEALAEQIPGGCHIMTGEGPIPAGTKLLVTTEPLTVSHGFPVITVSAPLRMQGLLADMQAAQSLPETIALPRGFSLSFKQKLLNLDGKTVDVTDKEAGLLQCLAAKKGAVVGKDELLKTVWGIESALDTHTLETHIYRLRNKFRELGGEEIVIAEGGGYRLRE